MVVALLTLGASHAGAQPPSPPGECVEGVGGGGCAAAGGGAFVPTEEWQEVLPGQQVPDSCDVKVDLATGKEFARNRPAATTSESGGIEVVEDAAGDLPTEAERAQERAEAAGKMYHILMGLPEPPPELEAEHLQKLAPAELEALVKKLWVRRQEYLADVQDDSVKTEQEVLQGDLEILKLMESPANDEELGSVLEELEYLVAQTDNAQSVAKLQGWPTIVKFLRAPTDAVAKAAAWIVGTAVKLDEQVCECMGRGGGPAL
eukprot:COSAG01_NODE_2619_length_7370_cov_8.551506_1_plen_261_part_00